MLNDWPNLLDSFRGASGLFAEPNSALVRAYKGLGGAAFQPGALDVKTKELIALAVAVTTRCDGCISSHAAAAAKAGATAAELAEALGVAIALNAGAAYVYSVRATEAFGQFSERGSS
ncbi:MAG TPA: carboxymuconolactone decarboxylase family protein [Bradyrhizobium sp.]|nr:carboxymuconolactone decarboxylase family protein [Bradyrhizobium sp.]